MGETIKKTEKMALKKGEKRNCQQTKGTAARSEKQRKKKRTPEKKKR